MERGTLRGEELIILLSAAKGQFVPLTEAVAVASQLARGEGITTFDEGSAGELLQFEPAGFTGHRVRVQGVVTHQKVGDALWIRDGSRGLRVVSAQAGPISPGEWVDIVGFVDRSGYAPSLGDAVFRRLKGGEPPEPIWLTEFAEAVRHEANLIRIEAALQEVQIEPAGVRLRLDWNGRQIEGLLDGAKRESLPVDWQPGSRVRVAGIGAVPPQTLPRESGLWSVTSFQLLLRTPADVEVVQGAPWWNPSGRRLSSGSVVNGSI